LNELVRYCNEEHHLGALMLTGEWGCGKTFLIEKELAEALKETHFIVRVSLLGLENIEALNDAVRKQWLKVCTPFLGKMKQERERLKTSSYVISTIMAILKSLTSVGGSVASAVVAVDPLEYIPLEPVVEDLHHKGVKKRVILVFDDLSRSRLDLTTLVGTVNEYCENMNFTTIIVSEEGFIRSTSEKETLVYRMIKEKTVERTVRYVPDYKKIIHNIIADTEWQDEEYAEYLGASEEVIYDAFVTEAPGSSDRIGKHHNFRSLTCALREFWRFYQVLTEHQVPDIDKHLYAFIAYIVVARSGIFKGGKLCFKIEEEYIRQLYPDYMPEMLPECIRQWIDYGIWDEEEIMKQISVWKRPKLFNRAERVPAREEAPDQTDSP
jgi:hypothetical protein